MVLRPGGSALHEALCLVTASTLPPSVRGPGAEALAFQTTVDNAMLCEEPFLIRQVKGGVRKKPEHFQAAWI